MRAQQRRLEGRSAIEIMDEAIHLLRTSPAEAYVCYYAGSVPFMMAALYFWADLTNGSAGARLPLNAFVMAVLFIWMKCWHYFFCRKLMHIVRGGPARGAAGAGWFWPALIQAILQPTGLLLIPVSLVLSFPFAWVYAGYQNLSALEIESTEPMRSVLRRAWRQAALWPKQNHLIIWLLSPWLLVAAAISWLVFVPLLMSWGEGLSEAIAYLLGGGLLLAVLALNPLGSVVAVNIALAMVAIPQLLRMFFGVETSFTRTSVYVFNTTFMAITCGLTYLALDPVVKAVYVLRCFYGEALQTGGDLRALLKNRQQLAQKSLSIHS